MDFGALLMAAIGIDLAFIAFILCLLALAYVVYKRL